MKRKNKFLYSSSIKLGPALGDWTQLSSEDLDDEYFDVTTISSTNFDKLSRKELKKSHLIHHKLASLIAKHLSKDMNIKIELHTIMVTQILYSDFINSINDNIFQADLNIKDQGSVNLIFGSNLASMMIDRLTGGKGENTDKNSFNELEMTLLNEQLQEIIPFFTTSWKESLDISKAKLSFYSGEYKVDNKISYRETYIVFTVYLYFGDGELMRLMIAYPNELIRNLLKQELKTKQVISPEIKFQAETLDKVSYPVKAELGEIELPMHSISELSEGDVIPLNQEINTLIKLDIGNKIKLYAQPCIFKNKIGCQVIVTEDYKSNIILRKKDTANKETTKKIRLPIDQIVDQESKSKTTIFNFDDDKSTDDKKENLAEYLPQDLDENITSLQEMDSEEEIIQPDSLSTNDESVLENDDSINSLESTEDELDTIESSPNQSQEDQEMILEDTSQEDLNESDDEIINETDSEEFDDDLNIEEDADSDETIEKIEDESATDTNDEINSDNNQETEPEETELDENIDESLDLDDDFDFDNEADGSEKSDLENDEPSTEVDEQSVENTDNSTNTSPSDTDDLIDEELDFGDIEASLEDDSLDWDETEPEEPK